VDQDYFRFVHEVAPEWRREPLVVLTHEEHLVAALAAARQPLPVEVPDLASAVAALRADPLRRLLMETSQDVLSPHGDRIWNELRKRLSLPAAWAPITQSVAGRQLATLGLIEERSWRGPGGRHYALLRLASAGRPV
jgi:hypothetical protein